MECRLPPGVDRLSARRSGLRLFAPGRLEWRSGRGVVFGFMLDGWPALPPDQSGLRRIFWLALPLMLFAAIAILSFVLPNPFG
jgi:hypothetical protein